MHTKQLSIKEQLEAAAYADFTDDNYSRTAAEKAAIALGGRVIASSNDTAGNSGWSFSPTETWEFPNGEKVDIRYQDIA